MYIREDNAPGLKCAMVIAVSVTIKSTLNNTLRHDLSIVDEEEKTTSVVFEDVCNPIYINYRRLTDRSQDDSLLNI